MQFGFSVEESKTTVQIVYACLHLMPLTALLPELTDRVAIDVGAYTQGTSFDSRTIMNNHFSGCGESHAVVR